MKIITEEEMAARLDFRRPLHAAPDEQESVWCIPFEFMSGTKGTRISIAKAREISAELRALVAEAEFRQLRKAFDEEKKRNEDLWSKYSKLETELLDTQHDLADVKRKAKKQRTTKRPRA